MLTHLLTLFLGMALALLIGRRLGARWLSSLSLPTRLKRTIVKLILPLPGGQRLLNTLKQCLRGCKTFARSLRPRFRTATRFEDYVRLGQTLVREGLHDLAVEKFGKAIELLPCASRGYLYRGRSLHQVGRLQEANKDFQVALTLGDGTEDETQLLHAGLASLLVELRDIDRALFHAYCHLLLQRGRETGGEPFTPGFVPAGAEDFQVLIEAHDLLAEDTINRTGDFDAALDIFRRKRRLQERFAETFGLGNLPILYLPDDWVRNVGHMALLDFWVKMKHLGWGPWEQLVLLAPPAATANEAYLRYWKKHFTVISDPYLIEAVAPFARAQGSHVASLLELPDGREKYFCEGMGVIQEAWEQEGRPPLLELSPEDLEQGRQTLSRLGVPEDAWYVCLHVRSPGFHKEGEALHQAHRNADIRSYLPAVEDIIARGGRVIRLGDATMEPLPVLPGLIDYAHSPLKSPWMDVFLCASCRFFIGVASGLSHLPTTFGVPCALTNWVSNALPVHSRRDRFIPKLIWSAAEDRLLDFRESLDPAIRQLSYCGQKLQERNLQAVDNTPEEIQALVQEMFEILDGSVEYTPADECMQHAFRTLAGNSGLVGFSRLGRAFLRKYAQLLALEQSPASLVG